MDDYFLWLYELVGPAPNRKRYFHVLQELHEIEFYWRIDNDINRAEDGKSLRTKFISETGLEVYTDIDQRFLYRPCSLLEMMIALAYRWESDVMFDMHSSTGVGKWFWEMVDNLGLLAKRFEDATYDEDAEIEVKDKAYIFMDRMYSANGDGGIFPLEHPLLDQRTVEIWYQINQYFQENYQILD